MPSSPPENPKCDVLSSTSIYITWSPPPIDSQNGKIKGYKVFYISTDDLYEKDMHIVKSNNQYLTVENLKKYTNYTVYVVAFTKIGDGAKTSNFFCTTHEDGNYNLIESFSNFTKNIFSFCILVPSAPENIKAIPASNTKVIVSWLPPIHLNGEIVNSNLVFVQISIYVLRMHFIFRLATHFI